MKKHVPTNIGSELVVSLAGLGVPQAEIAARIGIDPKTLRQHYRAELDAGVSRANEAVARALFQKAISGDTTSMIFWLKTRAGWSTAIHRYGETLPGFRDERELINTPMDELTEEELEYVYREYFPEAIDRAKEL